MKTHNLLLVDDHPITIDAYINILSRLENPTIPKHFTTAYSCQDAYIKIMERYELQETLDVAFLDISLPPYEDKNIQNGIDLGNIIREYFPECKIILLTMHSEPILLHNAIQKINPEGFILKNDINAQSLMTAYQYIMLGQKFYSSTINDVLNQSIIKKLKFDVIDCEIITLLSRGIRTKDMTELLELSLSTIEKRKSNIKTQLLIDKGTDKNIIEEARKVGIL
ncbi:response regulator transcription factor [Flavobacterium sp. CHNK8]|uniref:response regulator n=1 Tax=Flavobacterium sp. CHNK8 TaxID=2871165 RepID=UPI001C8E38D0|nr:response regulator transcription factor [Flavobacterium sp. CHNK8]QZK91352.1 response regulator transcription factor [Flavobacterium sp. CHNK8]